jgi:hypothetical protein
MKGCEFGVLLSVTSLNAMLSSFEELRINSGEQSGFSNVDAARSSEGRSFVALFLRMTRREILKPAKRFRAAWGQ